MNIKRIAVLSQALVLTAAMVPAINISAKSDGEEIWGPQSRPVYKWDAPSDHPTFNSITNNPTIGDERNFVRVKEYGSAEDATDNVTIEGGKEYEVYVYVHNDAAANLNENGKGVANNVRLKTNFPTELKKDDAGMIKGIISATNTDPKEVWDTAFLNANGIFHLSYVPNSATIHNGGSANGQILDAESMFGDGAKLAYDNRYWGVIPGCNEFAGYITYRIKVEQPEFMVDKTASVNNTNNYTEEVNAKPGDTINFKVTYTNSGTIAQEGVKVHDNMPEGLKYVEGSTRITTTAGSEEVVADDGYLFGSGLDIGNFQPGESATITYQAKLSDSKDDFDCGDTVIYNDASVISPSSTQYDKVKIKVTRDDCLPDALPKTGPAEIIAASVILIVIGMGGTYWFVSYNKMRKIKSIATGEEKSPSDIVKDGFINK